MAHRSFNPGLLAVLTVLSLGPLTGPVGAQAIGTVNFDFDSDRLDSEGQSQVTGIADQLRETPAYKQTVVVGYTDAVGTGGYNDALGLRRARQVAEALEALGIPVGRIGSVSSRGERDLLVAVTGRERANRRVTVTLSDILGACRSHREIPIRTSDIGAGLQQDLLSRLEQASRQRSSLGANGTNTAAYQMAGAARLDCRQATAQSDGSQRKLEYAQRCFCSSARLQVALGATGS